MKKLILPALLFVGLHLYLGGTAIRSFAPTYDEPVHLTSGYVYWTTGDYRMNGLNHPAWGEMWPALPLLFMNPQLPLSHPSWLIQRWKSNEIYQFADVFFFKNNVSPDRMMEAGRWMQLCLSVVLGLVLAWGALRVAGPKAGFWALGFWSVSPTFLSHGSLVSTDLPFAAAFFFYFLSLHFWKKWIGNIFIVLLEPN